MQRLRAHDSAERYAIATGYAVLALASLAFIVLQAYAFAPHRSDEGIYAYQAASVLRGLIPYRDFFHAHPPLHLAPTVLLMAVFGPSPWVVDVVPAACALAQGWLAFAVVRRAFEGSSAGVLGGALAGAVWLLSPSVLRSAANDTGIMQASLALHAGVVALAFERRTLAGICLGIAPCVLPQAAPAAVIAVIASLNGPERRGRVLLIAFGVWLAVQLAGLSLAGSAYIEQVYGYHLSKQAISGEGLHHFRSVLARDAALFAAATIGATTALAFGDRKLRTQTVVLLAMITATVAVLATRPRVFPYYFQPAFLPAAALAGLGVAAIARLTAARSGRPAGALAGTIVLAVALSASVSGGGSMRWLAPWRADELDQLRRDYTWVDAPGLGAAANGLVKALLWEGGIREPGRTRNVLTAFLWQRSRWLDAHPMIVAAVSSEAARGPVTLFGDSSVVPRVALESGISITAELADTNLQRFSAGTLSTEAVIEILARDPTALVLLGRHSGLGTQRALRAFVVSNLRHVASFPTATGDTYDLYRSVPRS